METGSYFWQDVAEAGVTMLAKSCHSILSLSIYLWRAVVIEAKHSIYYGLGKAV